MTLICFIAGRKELSGDNIADKDKPQKISRQAWLVVSILSSLATMVMYAETMLIPAIPDLIFHFNVSYNTSSWILTAYLIPAAIMTPIAGKLSDIYGKKKILLLIMSVYAFGVVIAGFSPDIYFLLFSRAIQGVGIAMFPIAFSIVNEQFPREKISIGQGIISSMFATGAVLGLSIGGLIVINYGWQSTFFTTIPIALAMLFIIRHFIKEPALYDYDSDKNKDKRKIKDMNQSDVNKNKRNRVNINTLIKTYNIKKIPRNIDTKGALFLAISITSLLMSLTFLETSSHSGSEKQSITVILALVATGIFSTIFFIITERKVAFPLIDLDLVKHRILLPANLIIMTVGFSMFMVFQTIPILVQSPMPSGFGLDAANAGYIQLPFAIVILVFGPASGFIVSKVGSLKPIVIGTAITSIGFFSLSVFHSSPYLVSVNLALLSAGLALTNVGTMNVTMLAAPRQFTGVSLGMTNMLRIIGSTAGPAVAGVYLQAFQFVPESDLTRSFPSDQAFTTIFLTAMIISIFSTSIALVLLRKSRSMKIPNLI